MICLAAIDNNVFTEYLLKNPNNNNFQTLIKSILKDYEYSTNIVIADNENGDLIALMARIIRKTDGPMSILLQDFINLVNNFPTKPLIRSFNKHPSLSNYIDFKITYKSETNDKEISIDDEKFEKKINDMQKNYKPRINSNLFNSNKNDFEYMLDKIFLSSKEIKFLRFSFGNNLMPFSSDFTSINDTTFGVKQFKDALKTIYFLINPIINVKKESIFFKKDTPVNMIFYSFIDRNEIRHNDEYELNLEKCEELLQKNLSHYSCLREVLNSYNIKLNFNIFVFLKNDFDIREDIKNEFHKRLLYISNGIFHLDHDELVSKFDVPRGDNKAKIRQIGSFTIQRTIQEEFCNVDSLIFNNSKDLKVINTTFPKKK